MNWLKRKSLTKDLAQFQALPPRYPPQVHQYRELEEWLAAWVTYRLEEVKGTSREYRINGISCLGLLGSLGLDSAIAEDGTFFIHLGLEDDATWKKATPKERSWLVVCVQRRLYPEFSVMLPLRPERASDCAICEGTGFIYNNSVVCASCGTLGWVDGSET